MTAQPHDFTTDGTAWVNREIKAKPLGRWCWDHGITPDEIPGTDPALLRKAARAVGVNPPTGDGTGPTWTLVAEKLHQMAAYTAARGLRAAPEPRPHWWPPTTPDVTEPREVTTTPPGSPRGWAALAALPPIPDRICDYCPSMKTSERNPAIVGTPDGWRCAQHPPTPRQWGHTLNWTPNPNTNCPPARCYCGRHPRYGPNR